MSGYNGDISNFRLKIPPGAGETILALNDISDSVRATGGYLAIDTGTVQAEVRWVPAASIAGATCAVSALAFAHAVDDRCEWIPAPIFPLRLWGAKEDDDGAGAGIDDTAAVNAAIVAVSGLDTPNLIKDGISKISAPVVMYANVGIVGRDPLKDYFFLAASSDCNMIESRYFADLQADDDAYDLPLGIRLRCIGLDGNKANQSAGAGGGVVDRAGIAFNTDGYQIERVKVFNCKGEGAYFNGTRKLRPTYSPGNLPATTEYASYTKPYIYDLFITRCDGNGLDHRGPGDVYIDWIWSFLNTGYGVRVDSASNIGYVHSYNNTEANFYFGDNGIRADRLEARDGKKEGIIFVTSGSHEIGMIYCINNDSLAGGTNAIELQASVTGVQIGELLVTTTVGGNAVYSAGSGLQIGTARIDGNSHADSIIGLRLNGANNRIGYARILGFDGGSGVGIEANNLTNSFVCAKLETCDTGLSKTGAGGGYDGNRFDIAVDVSSVTTPLAGDGFGDEELVRWTSQGAGTHKRSPGTFISTNFSVGSGTGTFSKTITHDMIQLPLPQECQISLVPPDATEVEHSLVSATYGWTVSGSGTNEYYVRLAAGTNPALIEPTYVSENSVNMAAGTIGALAAGEWDWGDNDALGYSTIYVRLADGADPDSKAAAWVECSRMPATNWGGSGIITAIAATTITTHCRVLAGSTNPNAGARIVVRASIGQG